MDGHGETSIPPLQLRCGVYKNKLKSDLEKLKNLKLGISPSYRHILKMARATTNLLE